MNNPTKIHTEDYWTDPPPELSPRCRFWIDKITNGWRKNKRISKMGYYEASEYFGVYIWEYCCILIPLFEKKPWSEIAVALVLNSKKSS